jgi:hypothetical protein
MRNEYEDNPNICYAIGDSVGDFLGSGTENHQPSSGVEEQISSIHKAYGTDNFAVFDGSTELRALTAAARTDLGASTAGSITASWNNSALMVSNSWYLKKAGTTDTLGLSGVQTNA